MAEIKQTEDARQGKRGRPILYVLVAGIALAVIAGVGLLTWQGADAPTKDHASQSRPGTHTATSGGGNPIGNESPGSPNNPVPAQQKAN